METKQCNKCKEFKALLFFGKRRAKKDGLYETCRDCMKDVPSRVSAMNRNKLKSLIKRRDMMGARRWKDGGGGA